jgi:hypothetical protein
MSLSARVAFGLLIAVGWLSCAIAQTASDNSAAPASAEKTVQAKLESMAKALAPALESYDYDGPTDPFVKKLPGDWAELTIAAPITGKESGDGLDEAAKKICGRAKTHLDAPPSSVVTFSGYRTYGKDKKMPFELRSSGRGTFYRLTVINDSASYLFGSAQDYSSDRHANNMIAKISTTELGILPLSDDVMSVEDKNDARQSLWVRCSPDWKDGVALRAEFALARNAYITSSNRYNFLRRADDGTVPFMNTVAGTWTITNLDFFSAKEWQTPAQLCSLRRVELRADHSPLPILSSHVLDTTPAKQRRIPREWDQFELRFVDDNLLLRVPQQDPLEQWKQSPNYGVVPPKPKDFDYNANQQRQRTINAYRFAALASAEPIQLTQIDDDTLLESPAMEPDKKASADELSRRLWLRCPSN